ncbi:hypothetical protein GGD67_002875 [Bradyrhizobium sp. IAR9]|nr:hypothetical protein [Bradyrhizobium sp. IAR9]
MPAASSSRARPTRSSPIPNPSVRVPALRPEPLRSNLPCKFFMTSTTASTWWADSAHVPGSNRGDGAAKFALLGEHHLGGIRRSEANRDTVLITWMAARQKAGAGSKERFELKVAKTQAHRGRNFTHNEFVRRGDHRSCLMSQKVTESCKSAYSAWWFVSEMTHGYWCSSSMGFALQTNPRCCCMAGTSQFAITRRSALVRCQAQTWSPHSLESGNVYPQLRFEPNWCWLFFLIRAMRVPYLRMLLARIVYPTCHVQPDLDVSSEYAAH